MTLAAALTRAAHYRSYFDARLGTASLQYEFAERLWAMPLGPWAIGGVVPDLSDLCHGTDADGHVALGLTDPRGTDCRGTPPEVPL